MSQAKEMSNKSISSDNQGREKAGLESQIIFSDTGRTLINNH